MEGYMQVLKASPFFAGMTEEEIRSVLVCLGAVPAAKAKDTYVFRAGDATEVMGLVLSGGAFIVQEDLWGHRNILSHCGPGDFFGEPYAANPGMALDIGVVTETDSTILFLNVRRVLTACPNACEHHQKLIRNLVGVLSGKILRLNEKITHISKRTTREKLLSYLSAESLRRGSRTFEIPYDRQELADYLCVERAAMSAELSKMAREGILKTDRSRFELFGLPKEGV